MSILRSTFLVIGSGVAGLHTALEAAKHGTVHLVTKKEDFESNTNYAQGGIASVLDHSDSFESHIRDTMEAGAGLCHPEAVRLIVTHGPDAIEELIQIGVSFTKKLDGSLELGREGGHSFRRIVHSQDLTGREVEKALLEKVRSHENIELFEYFFGIDLILEENRCWGAWVWNEKARQIYTFAASTTILCTGGCGLVYLHSTNPPIATGDGVCMGFRAGAKVANLEFIQFHPTSYRSFNGDKPFLISEAVRGEGGILRNPKGEAFMEKYHPQKDLAPRDIVARAIDNEIKNSGEDLCYLDVTHIDQSFFQERFPNISNFCMKQGLDLTKDWIPIVPAAHYMCGGIVTDLYGASCLKGLYAIGEAGCTGVHGANRLASNSILEALVFSKRAMEQIQELGLHNESLPDLDYEWKSKTPRGNIEAVRLVNCRRVLRQLMWDYVGIVRSNERLKLAKKRLSVLKEEIDGYFQEGHILHSILELRNLAQLADLIVSCAIERKESRGLHYNIDYPYTQIRAMDTIAWLLPNGDIDLESVPIPK